MLAPSKAPPRPKGKYRSRVYDVVMNKRGKFARFIVGVMIAHVIVICTEFYQQTVLVPQLRFAQEAISLLFLCVYMTEIALKLFALSLRGVRRIAAIACVAPTRC